MSRLLLLVIVCLFLYTNLYSQITYNIAKPMSYGNAQLNTLENLPTLDFDVKANGSVFNSNLNINVKTLAESEKLHGKNISRLKFKIKALSLGEMSLYFKDVKLQNGAYCFVYTNDYKIVAGPIYEKSINGNLNIMKLPASELILEVVYNNEPDFDLTLDGITYQSLVDLTEKKKKKNEHEILSGYDSCYTCDYGQVKYVDRALNCGYFGHGNDSEIFKLMNLKSATDYNYDAIRSSCLIMIPIDCEENIYSGTAQGTLMNFPYEDCSDPNNDCGKGFIFTVWHELNTNIIQKHLEEDYEYLENTLIRFNWNYKYEIPWHLENVNCDSSNPTLYNQWRSTVSFDDVIDYCGIEVFAYRTDSDFGDLVILKMNQRPFYKEHYLGWTTQAYFNLVDAPGEPFGNDYYNPINIEDYIGIGRRKPKPTLVMTNHGVYFEKYRDFQAQIDYYQPKRYHLIDSTKGDKYPQNWPSNFGFSGYSGSMLTFDDYLDSEQKIGLAIFNQADVHHTYRGFGSFSFHYMFYFDPQFNFEESCYSTQTKMNEYLALPAHESQLLTRQFTYSINGDTAQSSHIWYPSVNNKQKCPSNIGRDSTGTFTDSCDFNINTYVDYIYSNDTLCITIDSIPLHLFPENYLPMGYRVYHNFGEQKTLAFDSFADSANITYPIEFCMTSCDIMYLMTLGKENINIAIDFYDDEGRILNNPGCDSLNFSIDFPFEFCEVFDVDVRKIDSIGSCCVYEITIDINNCAENNPLIKKFLKLLSIQSFIDTSPTPIISTDITTMDYANGKIIFTYDVCNASTDTASTFKIFFENGELACESNEVEFTNCYCTCPSSAEMESWVNLNIEFGDPYENGCPEYMCYVSANFNIPSIYNCYFQYAVNDPMARQTMPQNGSINLVPNCVYKGLGENYTFYLFKGPFDNEPCVIEKSIYCPVQELVVNPCTPDCEEIPFIEPPEILEFELSGCPQCSVKVEYTHRVNSCNELDSRQDLQVLSFELYSDEPDSCANCSLTPADVYSQAIHQIIFENEMGFQPLIFGCDTTWRVIQATCWADILPSGSLWPLEIGPIEMPMYAWPRWSACDTDGCCIKDLMVCRTPQGISVTTLDSSIPSDSCGAYSKTFHLDSVITVTCEDTCEWLDGLDIVDFSGKRAVFFEQGNMNSINDLLNSNFVQKDKYIDIQVLSEISSNNFKISIVNLLGSELLKVDSNLKKGYNEYTINTTELSTGIYFIYIKIDGGLLSSQKFMLIK